MASQITSLTVVYSTVYSDADQRKHQSSASPAFVWGIHRDGEFPAQRASYAENVSIWWRHHASGWSCEPKVMPETSPLIQGSIMIYILSKHNDTQMFHVTPGRDRKAGVTGLKLKWYFSCINVSKFYGSGQKFEITYSHRFATKFTFSRMKYHENLLFLPSANFQPAPNQYHILSIYRSRMRKEKIQTDLAKEIPHLAFAGELWGVISKFVEEKIPRDIERVHYIKCNDICWSKCAMNATGH